MYRWPSIRLQPRETSSVSLELERPFILEWVMMGPTSDLGKLSVVDLRSGGRSLFTSVGPFLASMFGETSWGPTFGATVTRVGEELVLEVANLSGDEVKFYATAFGRSFNTFQEGTDYLDLAKT